MRQTDLEINHENLTENETELVETTENEMSVAANTDTENDLSLDCFAAKADLGNHINGLVNHANKLTKDVIADLKFFIIILRDVFFIRGFVYQE
jgi:hypothetical protein